MIAADLQLPNFAASGSCLVHLMSKPTMCRSFWEVGTTTKFSFCLTVWSILFGVSSYSRMVCSISYCHTYRSFLRVRELSLQATFQKVILALSHDDQPSGHVFNVRQHRLTFTTRIYQLNDPPWPTWNSFLSNCAHSTSLDVLRLDIN